MKLPRPHMGRDNDLKRHFDRPVAGFGKFIAGSDLTELPLARITPPTSEPM